MTSSTKNQISYFTLAKGCDRLKLDTSADDVKKMKTNKQTKTEQNKTNKQKRKIRRMLHWFFNLSQTFRHIFFLASWRLHA